MLYFAGHGDPNDGRFCLEKREHVSLDDILASWAASAPYRAGGSKLLIVADSCFSGAMAARLRALCTGRATRLATVAQTVAVQAACAADEVSYGGTFTHTYVKEVAKGRRVLDRHLLFYTTRFPTHMQHPEFYCPWGEAELSTGPRGKTLPLYKA